MGFRNFVSLLPELYTNSSTVWGHFIFSSFSPRGPFSICTFKMLTVWIPCGKIQDLLELVLAFQKQGKKELGTCAMEEEARKKRTKNSSGFKFNMCFPSFSWNQDPQKRLVF